MIGKGAAALIVATGVVATVSPPLAHAADGVIYRVESDSVSMMSVETSTRPGAGSSKV